MKKIQLSCALALLLIFSACSKEEKKPEAVKFPESGPVELNPSQPKVSVETQKVIEREKAMRAKRLKNPNISDKELLGPIPTPKF